VRAAGGPPPGAVLPTGRLGPHLVPVEVRQWQWTGWSPRSSGARFSTG
jgi:hypothetical protein